MSVTSQLGASLHQLAQTSVQPLAVMAAITTIIGLTLAGRILVRRADPASSFAMGMGGFVLLSTMIGLAGWDVRLGLIPPMAAAAWILSRPDRFAGWGRGPLLVLATILPLLLLLSDRQGSEWDEFSHWLHAFRYLAVWHVLPGGAQAPAMDSCCAAYPYGWPLVGMAAMSLSGFSEAIPALLNILLLALFAVLLLDLALDGRPADFGAAAMAVLAATIASPTFVHKLAFSAYADVATAFLAAMLAVMGERIATGETDTAPWRRAVGFGLAAAALLAVKPGNAALFGCVLGGAALVALRHLGWRGVLRVQLLPMVLLPLLGSVLWRWHVGKYLSGQEMVILDSAHWHVAQIPLILKGMADVAVNKGGHFGLGLVMVVLGLRGLARDAGRVDRLCALAGLAFLGYNLFLLITYVVVFGEYEALHVASYWRYNTHLGLIIMLPAAIYAGRLAARLQGTKAANALGILAVLLVLAGPGLMAGQIRFDADPMKVFLRQALRQAGTAMPPGETAVVVDPSGSGLTGVFATYEWSGRVRSKGYFSAFNAEPPLTWLARQNVNWAFVASGQDRMGLEPATAALLLHRDGLSWTVVEQFPYPGGKVPERWP
ncbi:hypothetical protein [Magnetospirillum sp. 15-1]|uniref:hypothetical protein n=1 Tax=Magnetospirillum sp. 15-1 TaxID=1979370 RepID=UPI000BBC8898|nr:hypothetical protein [Magnetospirillum sp. 15-1]